ncbi:hypothetical protein FSPOR_2500 [Fusarium sporotrichioides]|uniref:Uncharacterized protein n=1 Tax=Fusarium sporotrichioides TaxID=5514 RepID=A0A395SJX1_FUSSP|nr:hypothetical protein FSPOR_2500 [Fusarium sporotrichioides]
MPSPTDVIIAEAKSSTDLIKSARKLIQDFRDAQSSLRDDIPNLIETAKAVEELDKPVTLVQQEGNLHTAAVIREIKSIIRLIHHANGLCDWAIPRQKKAVTKNGLKAGVPTKLKYTFRAASRWVVKRRDALEKGILCAQVGLVGNMEGTFKVQYETLFHASAKVREMIGMELILAMSLRRTMVTITDEAIESNKHVGGERIEQERTKSDIQPKDTKSGDTAEDWVYDNITEDQARGIAGEAGVQGWKEAVKLRSKRRTQT